MLPHLMYALKYVEMEEIWVKCSAMTVTPSTEMDVLRIALLKQAGFALKVILSLQVFARELVMDTSLSIKCVMTTTLKTEMAVISAAKERLAGVALVEVQQHQILVQRHVVTEES